MALDPSSKKILVADPLMIRRKPLVHQLSSLGFPEASEAESGSESLIRLKSEPHHALICSSNLENPDSLTLLKRIRESPNLAKLKVVLFFEDQEDERIVSATRAGMAPGSMQCLMYRRCVRRCQAICRLHASVCMTMY